MTYVTISELARRWRVDRATARTAVSAAAITASPLHTSPRYLWDDVLGKIENWPDTAHPGVDLAANLLCANELADYLGVTPQTVRNYARQGRLHTVKLTGHTTRYAAIAVRK